MTWTFIGLFVNLHPLDRVLPRDGYALTYRTLALFVSLLSVQLFVVEAGSGVLLGRNCGVKAI